ncbi:E3 ubiquitin-protein ligase RNFT1-like [Achroia grisella]|uniref:E3 ubiquitin-protein ligase RNFT1-like n=1 Tax=Achroia grisella TaxID=688607 RepID=UPI0027D22985|nr:E3 ubiquitin-protein ligase RNFT1-like [Achroia grisella]
MISYVAKVINLIAITIQKVFLIASFTGKVIVAVGTTISSLLVEVISNIYLFIQITYEDNVSIFTEDIPNFVDNVIYTFGDQVTYIQRALVFILETFSHRFNLIVDTVKSSVIAVFVVVGEIIFLLKNGIILLGDTLWLIITFIPVHLPQLLKAGFMSLNDIIVGYVVDAYMSLLKITNFLTDVPLESFIGIISAIIIVRLSIHFRETIQIEITEFYWSFIRKFMYIYYTLYNYFTDPEVRVITHMASGQDVTSREASFSENDVDDANNPAEALCVICQERQKCVLTLPCRHVCLCTECCRRLYGYQRTCPVCRTFIYHSVNVYL